LCWHIIRTQKQDRRINGAAVLQWHHSLIITDDDVCTVQWMSMQTSQKFIIGSVKLPKTVEGYVNRGIIVKGYFLERKKNIKVVY